MVVVQPDGFEQLQQWRKERVHVCGLRLPQSELAPHEPLVFGEEGGAVFGAGGLDDGFGARYESGAFFVGLDAFSGEGGVVRVEAAEELGGVFGEPDQVPPNYCGLVFVRVAEEVVVMVGGVVWVEVLAVQSQLNGEKRRGERETDIHKRKRAKIKREPENRGIIRVQHAVHKCVRLPFRHRLCVPPDNLPIRFLVPVPLPFLLYVWRELQYIVPNIVRQLPQRGSVAPVPEQIKRANADPALRKPADHRTRLEPLPLRELSRQQRQTERAGARDTNAVQILAHNKLADAAPEYGAAVREARIRRLARAFQLQLVPLVRVRVRRFEQRDCAAVAELAGPLAELPAAVTLRPRIYLVFEAAVARDEADEFRGLGF